MGHHNEHHEHHIVHRNDHARLIAIILVLCLLAFAGYALQHTISCFLLSWIIAYLLDPVIMWIERKNFKRIYAISLVYTVLGILTIFFFTFMLPQITMSWDAFIRDLPLYIQKIKQTALDWKTRIPSRYGSDEIQWLIDKGAGNIDAVVEKSGAWTYSFVRRMFFNIFNIALSPILVFFMLYYKQTVIETLTSWIPEKRREIILGIGAEVNSSIGGYIRGQVIVSLIVAIFISVTLFFMEVPHPLFCGIFAGAASVLPFIGIIIAIIPALFFSWFQYQSMAFMIKTAVAFSVIYFLEGYVVKPLVFKESMNLNPLVTIIMVMALGEIIGFWGILLALPIAAAMKITWGHILKGDFRQ